MPRDPREDCSCKKTWRLPWTIYVKMVKFGVGARSTKRGLYVSTLPT